MNRVIEFRAWDKDHKVMYDWNEISIEKDQVFSSDGDIYISYDHCVLMQFTGLLDKNGKKIFEGDILKDKDGIISIVEYRNCEFVKKDRISVPPLFASSGYLQIEVIGNLYENPDLCK